jgi:hypothetical protein
MTQIKVNQDCAYRWSMAAYAHTLSEGHYVTTAMHKIPGAGIFHMAAKRLGLAVPVKTKMGDRNAWANIDRPPSHEEAAKMMKFYAEYTKRQTESFDMTQLDRIEEKLDRLLEMWKESA